MLTIMCYFDVSVSQLACSLFSRIRDIFHRISLTHTHTQKFSLNVARKWGVGATGKKKGKFNGKGARKLIPYPYLLSTKKADSGRATAEAILVHTFSLLSSTPIAGGKERPQTHHQRCRVIRIVASRTATHSGLLTFQLMSTS